MSLSLSFSRSVFAAALLSLASLAPSQALAAPAEMVPYEIVLDTLHSGYDGTFHFVHPRIGAIPRGPNSSPQLVLAMLFADTRGSDIYLGQRGMRSNNLGRTWMGPYPVDGFAPRDEGNGVSVMAGELWPSWHAKSGKLLGTGHTIRYKKGVDPRYVSDNNHPKPVESLNKEAVWHGAPRHTTYSVYDVATQSWGPWAMLEMPAEKRFRSTGAGSTQRVDLPDGDILLPIYLLHEGETDHTAMVIRCGFDGTTLKVKAVGNELKIKGARGFAEPSLVKFGNRFFLTLRNDAFGYVAASDDGLHFDTPKIWTWDDGTELGTYNTQQHWVARGDRGLFLVYTRRNAPADHRYSRTDKKGTRLPDDPQRGASNDHVARHRAPLYIAQVDPETLTVMRSTERILVPERGARLDNFGVTEVNADETWVTVSEWMQKSRTPQEVPGDWIIPLDNPRGANNSIYAARILWKD